jgi:hypothetical protein
LRLIVTVFDLEPVTRVEKATAFPGLAVIDVPGFDELLLRATETMNFGGP